MAKSWDEVPARERIVFSTAAPYAAHRSWVAIGETDWRLRDQLYDARRAEPMRALADALLAAIR